MAFPTMHELFYGYNEPTWIINNTPPPYHQPPRMPQPLPRQFVPQNQTQDVLRPLRKEVPVSVVTRPGVSTGPPVSTLPSHLVLRVPLCCEKCIDKVKKALYEVEGVRNVECDQAEQKVIVSGNVDPERAVRRVRRVKKKSLYWNMETKPLRSF
jgi:copper chaperone CopZ